MAVLTILPQTAPLSPTYADLADLAHDLMLDEPCMRLLEATNRAADLMDDLDTYAVEWELFAEAGGNPLAFAIFP